MRDGWERILSDPRAFVQACLRENNVTGTESTPTLVAACYRRMREHLTPIRNRLNRPFTLADKLLFGHLDDETQELSPWESYLQIRPDRVAMQDATAQMALLQFMLAGRDSVAAPTTVHCDHLIRAHVGASTDLQTALVENDEVYGFLKSVSARYGIGFWAPGSGIIHQVILENYAFPGGLLIGTDSHTPNAGGLGMLAIGVGGADAVDVMVDLPWETLHPRVVGVRLTGELTGWAAPKDVILKLAGILTTSGGTNRIIEYFGPGTQGISCTGKATITNMGAELGATTSVFPYDDRMATYLHATDRAVIAALADANRDLLGADVDVEQDPTAFYDQVVEIDLSDLEPHVVGPHRPDRARPISELSSEVADEGFSDRISAALLGSCTNSSYEDISRAADVAHQAAAAGIRASVPLLVTPGSEMVRATIERDGQLGALESIGAKVLANACGPCIGQWRREDIAADETGDALASNSIVTSFNRNFPRRNDGSPNTEAFIASPELTVAFALSGRLSFNPMTDSIDGDGLRLNPPGPAPDVPPDGFTGRRHGYIEPPTDPHQVEVGIAPGSGRLELLRPFTRRLPEQFKSMPVLLKATGQCTTDAISPAGPWLRYRGHLTRISDNMFSGATNAYAETPGMGHSALTEGPEAPLSEVAKRYAANGVTWIAVGDSNYGEGSSREHAAMSPRLLGAGAIVVRSFARIHESNLKKQGVLPLTFTNTNDYHRILADDRVSLVDVGKLAPGRPIMARIDHADGSRDHLQLAHTLTDDQISWFWAGSALNLLRENSSGT